MKTAAALAPPPPSMGTLLYHYPMLVHSDPAFLTPRGHRLNVQLIDSQNCLVPGLMKSWKGKPGLSTTGPQAFEYLQEPARDAFVRVGSTVDVTVTSGLRTLPQQWLLWRWGAQGICGIGLAAPPGGSNHNHGTAVDLSNWEAAGVRTGMEAQGFVWFGSSDPVHFTYTGAGVVDVSKSNVQAFQQLWNANNPDDTIAEDGVYGPETEARLKISPADGWSANKLAPCDDARTPSKSTTPGDIAAIVIVSLVASVVAGAGVYAVLQHRRAQHITVAKAEHRAQRRGGGSGGSSSKRRAKAEASKHSSGSRRAGRSAPKPVQG